MEWVWIRFNKYLHETDRGVLVLIGNKENWLPKKLCRNVIVNNKLGGHMDIAKFIAEEKGIDFEPSVTYIKHVPNKIETKETKPDADLAR